ncbi:MAG: TrmH family RNA methyltransferase [Myxococcota bacterium]
MASPKTEAKRLMRRQPRPSGELMFWLHDVEDPVNVGSAFRIADAVGAAEVLLSGITPVPPHRLISKVGRNKDKRVSWRSFDPEAEMPGLSSQGWKPIAVEISPDALPYPRFPFPKRVMLVVGHEDHGIPKKIQQHCAHTVFIPMYGKGASLNVHVALAVVAFHYRHGPMLPDT